MLKQRLLYMLLTLIFSSCLLAGASFAADNARSKEQVLNNEIKALTKKHQGLRKELRSLGRDEIEAKNKLRQEIKEASRKLREKQVELKKERRRNVLEARKAAKAEKVQAAKKERKKQNEEAKQAKKKLIDRENLFSMATLNEGDPWRFEMKCGRDKYVGFLFFKLEEAGKKATVMSFASNRSQMFNPENSYFSAESHYDKSTRKLKLKTLGYAVNSKRRAMGSGMPATDFHATADSSGTFIKGEVKNSANCSTFQARKTSFDVRRNAKGILPVIQGGAKISPEICEKFIDWYVSASPVKAASSSNRPTFLSSAIIDSGAAVEKLGVAYDGFTKGDSRTFQTLRQRCYGLLKQAADTKSSELMTRLKKADGQAVERTPYVFQGGIKESKWYGWYLNMYYATAIRDVRRVLPEKIKNARNFPVSLAGLDKIKRVIIEGQSTDGIFDAMPKQDRDEYLEILTEIQNGIARKVVDKELSTVKWESFSSSQEGIRKLNAKHSQVKTSFASGMPAAGLAMVDRKFRGKHEELSANLLARLTKDFKGVSVSLKGLRSFRKTRESYNKKYRPSLTARDMQRLTYRLDEQFDNALSKASPQISRWLDKKILSNQSGIDELDRISTDIFGAPVVGLEKSKVGRKQVKIAEALQKRRNQIRERECIFDKGFQEMRNILCT
jgi:hypothetical protein